MIIEDKLMKYVVFKRRTKHEVKTKCQKLGYEKAYIDEIIKYLSENDYINDDTYIEKHIQNIMRLKRASIYEIKVDLLKRGINENKIEDYIENNEEALQEFEKQSAKIVTLKKLKSSEEIEKVKRYLRGKGYSYNSIREAIDNYNNLNDNK